MNKLPVLLCLLLLSAAGFAQSRFSIETKWTFSALGEDLGLPGIVAEDIDKNGRVELVLTSSREGAGFTTRGYFSVVEYNPVYGRYDSKYTSPLFFSAIASLRSFDIDGDGNRELLAGFVNGDIRIFDNQYREIRFTRTSGDNSIFNSGGISSIDFGDIDNDGQNNIVATNGDSTYIYNTTMQLVRKFKLAGGRVVLANIDQDAALETIYSSGRVVQMSSTQTVTEFKFFPYSYSPTRVRVADMNSDGILDIIYNSRDSVHMVSGVQKRKFRSIVKNQNWSSSDVSDFQLYDYTLDGVPDVFVGNDQFDVLYVYDGQTTLFDYDIQDPKRNGVDALAIAALDDQAGPEIIWTSGAHCSCSDHLFVYDMGSKQMKWMSRNVTQGFQAFDFGNINSTVAGDHLELVVGSYGTYTNYYEENFLSTFDLNTKRILQESNGKLPGIYADNPTALEIADLDNDGKGEILAGHESTYSSATVGVYNENYEFQRSFAVDGMSYIADLEVTDVNSDGHKELIVTSGTNVAGSTHPDEWQNYIYLFDAQTGVQLWRSAQLAGMFSRFGNIRVANIDEDPAKEIVILGYYAGWNSDKNGILYIIDGWTFELKTDNSRECTAFDLSDFDQDGRADIVAAISGKIMVLDGETMHVKKEFNPSKGEINALECVDLNDDEVEEYIFSNTGSVFIYDIVHGVISESERLGEYTGLYSPIRVNKTASGAEVYVAASHTLYGFNIAVTPNVAPTAFRPLTPVDNASLPQPERIDFSWENADDDEPLRYSVHITGADLDTVITVVSKTHIGITVSLFTKNESYTWSVTASDGLAQTSTETFSFQVTDGVTTGIEAKEGDMVQIYPNPFSRGLVIRNESLKAVNEIKVFDRDGREQRAMMLDVPASSEVTISDMDVLPSGVYICTLLRDGLAVKVTKLVKR
jgi:hypothetical protein